MAFCKVLSKLWYRKSKFFGEVGLFVSCWYRQIVKIDAFLANVKNIKISTICTYSNIENVGEIDSLTRGFANEISEATVNAGEATVTEAKND